MEALVLWFPSVSTRVRQVCRTALSVAFKISRIILFFLKGRG